MNKLRPRKDGLILSFKCTYTLNKVFGYSLISFCVFIPEDQLLCVHLLIMNDGIIDIQHYDNHHVQIPISKCKLAINAITSLLSRSVTFLLSSVHAPSWAFRLAKKVFPTFGLRI